MRVAAERLLILPWLLIGIVDSTTIPRALSGAPALPSALREQLAESEPSLGEPVA